jgi:hypothetical protein
MTYLITVNGSAVVEFATEENAQAFYYVMLAYHRLQPTRLTRIALLELSGGRDRFPDPIIRSADQSVIDRLVRGQDRTNVLLQSAVVRPISE